MEIALHGVVPIVVISRVVRVGRLAALAPTKAALVVVAQEPHAKFAVIVHKDRNVPAENASPLPSLSTAVTKQVVPVALSAKTKVAKTASVPLLDRLLTLCFGLVHEVYRWWL